FKFTTNQSCFFQRNTNELPFLVHFCYGLSCIPLAVVRPDSVVSVRNFLVLNIPLFIGYKLCIVNSNAVSCCGFICHRVILAVVIKIAVQEHLKGSAFGSAFLFSKIRQGLLHTKLIMTVMSLIILTGVPEVIKRSLEEGAAANTVIGIKHSANIGTRIKIIIVGSVQLQHQFLIPESIGVGSVSRQLFGLLRKIACKMTLIKKKIPFLI